jgi:hypothetical protein
MEKTILKIDAAQRQIDTAIELWFMEKDPVPIHTLACSAYQIVHDINAHQGTGDLLYDNQRIKNERRKEVIGKLKEAYNFFKHADNDPNPVGSILFNRDATPFFILCAIVGLERLGVASSIFRKIFYVYFAIQNPHIFARDFFELICKNIPSEQVTHTKTTRSLSEYVLIARNTRPTARPR